MIWQEGISPAGLNNHFLRDLERAEYYAGFDFVITSAFRIGDAKCHGKGKAVDIKCHHSGERFRIVRALLKAGFMRIGIYDRHIHADRCRDRQQKVLWMGASS